MKFFLLFFVQFYLFVFFLNFCNATVSSEKDPKRSKVSSIYLTPTLRVGRRSDSTWNDNFDTRQLRKVIIIPRFGRNHHTKNWINEDVLLNKRSDNVGTGMWFGPRLGRVQKRESGHYPLTYILNDYPKTSDFGRDSDEIDDYEENSLYQTESI